MTKKIWKDEYEYKRLLEILDAYWLTEPDEERVHILLHFRHKNGETQDKSLVWQNPNTRGKPNGSSTLSVVTARELLEMDENTLLLDEIKKFYEIGDIQ